MHPSAHERQPRAPIIIGIGHSPEHLDAAKAALLEAAEQIRRERGIPAEALTVGLQHDRPSDTETQKRLIRNGIRDEHAETYVSFEPFPFSNLRLHALNNGLKAT